MPKQRITREAVIEAAFSLAREQGMEKVLVKELAKKLQCSVQPIYSYCTNMDELRASVEEKTRDFAEQFIRQRLDPGDLLSSVCRASMDLAGEEPNLAKILVFRSRQQVTSFDDLLHRDEGIDLYIGRQLGLTAQEAHELQLNIFIYSLGLGVLRAGSGISRDLLQSRLEMACELFLQQAKQAHKER